MDVYNIHPCSCLLVSDVSVLHTVLNVHLHYTGQTMITTPSIFISLFCLNCGALKKLSANIYGSTKYTWFNTLCFPSSVLRCCYCRLIMPDYSCSDFGQNQWRVEHYVKISEVCSVANAAGWVITHGDVHTGAWHGAHDATVSIAQHLLVTHGNMGAVYGCACPASSKQRGTKFPCIGEQSRVFRQADQ